MTDLEKLRAVFKEIGIPFHESVETYWPEHRNEDLTKLELRSEDSRGYMDFRCEFTFNHDGSWEYFGIWE